MRPLMALVWREAIVVLRAVPFWIAAAAYVAVLAVFVMIWGDGVPVVGAGTQWEQFTRFQWVVLVAALPWTAARCTPRALDDLILFAFATAQRPSRLVLARSIALSVCLTMFALLALPVVIVMQRVAAIPLTDAAAGLVSSAALATFVAAVATAAGVLVRSRVAAWLAATACSVVVAGAIPASSAALWLLAAVLVAAAMLLRADARLTYLPESSS